VASRDPRQLNNGFYVICLRKEIKRDYILDLVPRAKQSLQIARQGDRIAGYVHNAWRRVLCHCSNNTTGAAPRRIEQNKIDRLVASCPIAWPLLLYLGVGPTAGAYALFTAGLRRVPATAAGITSLLEPLTATLLGVLAFGESLGALGILGALLLLFSFGLLVVSGRPLVS